MDNTKKSISADIRVKFTEENRKSIDRIRMSRSEDDPISKILNLFKQMQKVSKDIPNALINTAVDKKEEIQDVKT